MRVRRSIFTQGQISIIWFKAPVSLRPIQPAKAIALRGSGRPKRVRGFSSPPLAIQKFQTQPIEELRMLDHDPVAAFADDVELGIRQALHHE